MNISKSQREAQMDPENQSARIRADLERRRVQGGAYWGGEDLAGKYVFVEGAVFHYYGKAESIISNVLWLTEARKSLDNDSSGITQSEDAGRISIPVSTIMMLAKKGELAWYP